MRTANDATGEPLAPVDELVADLAGRLRGPRRARGDLLAEVSAGLYDATESYQDGGLDRHAAACRAARDFGSPARLAPLYQAELTARHTRGTALLMGAGFPAVLLAWNLLYAAVPGRRPESTAMFLLSQVYQAVTLLAVLVAALSGLMLIRRARGAPIGGWDVRRLSRWLSRFTVISVVAYLVTAAAMAVLGGGQGAFAPTVPASLAVQGLSAVVAGATLHRAHRGRTLVVLPPCDVPRPVAAGRTGT
jgi:hypothetical protein